MAKEKIMHFRDGPGPIAVGQKVYVTNGQGGYHYRSSIEAVTKVGRELAYTNHSRTAFYLETGREKTDRGCPGDMYSSKEAYDLHTAQQKVVSDVYAYFRHSYRHDLSFEQATRIQAILNESKDAVRVQKIAKELK